MLWFSRGVLDLFAQELTALYARSGPAHSPRFPQGWRPGAVVLRPVDGMPAQVVWAADRVPPGRYRVLAFIDGAWQDQPGLWQVAPGPLRLTLPDGRATAVELLPDRREALGQVPACRQEDRC